MDDIFTCYRILDLEAGASLEEVKRSYRELVKVWHPDRFRGDPKLQAKAEEKLKWINLAYERLSKEPATGAAHRAASQPQPKPYPPRTGPKPRATQAHSAKSTQAHADQAHPQRTTTGGHKAERFFRWIRQPRVITSFAAFTIVVIVAAVQSGRRKIADFLPTPVPKITNVAIERNEKPAPVLNVAAQVGTNAETAYVEGKLALEFEQYQKDAASGNAAAQHDLGLMYATGTGVPKDEAKAFEWYAKAAAQGLVSAQYNVGVMYAAGTGVAKDDAKAVAWFQKATAQGDAAAQYNLGLMYATGRGVPKDDAKAVGWWQKAAAQGDATAEFSLGGMYYQGRGIPKDGDKAFKLWLRAADQGNAAAEGALVLAFEQYQKDAAQGNAAAQCNLGIMYARGRGVPKDESKAVEWLQKAAVHGIAVAQSELGAVYIYAEGRGVSKDEPKAVEWLQKAAAQGDDYALYMLGVMYAEGRGVAKDKAKAVELWRKGAAQGDTVAEEMLRTMSAAAGEVPKDGVRAPVTKYTTLPPTVSTKKPDDAMLRHLATDDRLVSGSLLVDRLREYAGKGKLTLDNGLPEDAYVKLILNRKLVAAFYVRSHEKFTYSTIPDGSYSVVYCTGYGWDGAVRNFARGRHACRYDDPLTYSTTKSRNGSIITTSTDVVTLTLHKVAGGL